MKGPNANPIRNIRFEPSDNGGFISKTERAATPRGKKQPYLDYEDRTTTAVHPTVQHAAAHLIQAFGGAKKGPAKKKSAPAKAGSRMGPQTGAIGAAMLGQAKDEDGY